MSNSPEPLLAFVMVLTANQTQQDMIIHLGSCSSSPVSDFLEDSAHTVLVVNRSDGAQLSADLGDIWKPVAAMAAASLPK